MIGKLVLTHGGLARELLAAANIISGHPDGFEALSLDWSDGFDEARAKVAAALERLDQGQGVLILTDMYGGTPCNIAMTFYQAGKFEVLTGVNLPMVLRLACQAGAGDGERLRARPLAAGQGAAERLPGREIMAQAGSAGRGCAVRAVEAEAA